MLKKTRKKWMNYVWKVLPFKKKKQNVITHFVLFIIHYIYRKIIMITLIWIQNATTTILDCKEKIIKILKFKTTIATLLIIIVCQQCLTRVFFFSVVAFDNLIFKRIFFFIYLVWKMIISSDAIEEKFIFIHRSRFRISILTDIFFPHNFHMR